VPFNRANNRDKTNRLRGELYPYQGGFMLCVLQICSFCYFIGGRRWSQAILQFCAGEQLWVN